MAGVQVWFKQDLRLDDHPGLDQALASGASVVPLFCFDPALYSHLLRAPHGLEGVPCRWCQSLALLQAAP